MRKSLLVAILLMCIFPINAFSLILNGINARIDAMGGVYLHDDIGWTIGEPCELLNFPDQMQGNLYVSHIINNRDFQGSLITVKTVGEKAVVGVMLNYWSPMTRYFLNEGFRLLDMTWWEADSLSVLYPMVPHFAVAFRINNNISFGISSFFEGIKKDKQFQRYAKYPSANGSDTISFDYQFNEVDKKIGYGGFTVNGWLRAENIHIRPSLSFAFPYLEGSENNNLLTQLERSLQNFPSSVPIGATNHTYTYDMTKGWNIGVSSLFRFFSGAHTFDLGVWYSNAIYNFEMIKDIDSVVLNIDGTHVSEKFIRGEKYSQKNSNNEVEILLGWSQLINKHWICAVGYDGSVCWKNSFYTDNYPDTTFSSTYHNGRIGVEYNSNRVGFIDCISLRSSLCAYWKKDSRKIDNNNYVDTSSGDLPWGAFFWGSSFGKRQLKIRSGIGIKIKRVQVDYSIDVFTWKQGLVGGLPTMLTTMSFDFGKKKN